MSSLGLLPSGFARANISKALKGIDLDREHWLIAYEAEWVVSKWMDVSVKPETAAERMPTSAPIPKSIEEDLDRLKSLPSTEDEAVAGLLDLFGDDFTGRKKRIKISPGTQSGNIR